jgi:hypothetical protein
MAKSQVNKIWVFDNEIWVFDPSGQLGRKHKKIKKDLRNLFTGLKGGVPPFTTTTARPPLTPTTFIWVISCVVDVGRDRQRCAGVAVMCDGERWKGSGNNHFAFHRPLQL